MLLIHLAVQNLNLSSFMLFLLILNLEFGIIIFFSSTQFNMHSISMLLIIIIITTFNLVLVAQRVCIITGQRREFVSGFTGSAGQF